MTTKLIFLGGGNMAEAIFAGLVKTRVLRCVLARKATLPYLFRVLLWDSGNRYE